MWGLWFVPLVGLIFIGVGIAALIGLFADRFRNPKRSLALIAAPFGCAAVPIMLFAMAATLSQLFAQSDPEAWEEIFGFPPSQDESAYLFDAFGSGAERELYMRIEPDEPTWQRIRRIPGFASSSASLETLIIQGQTHDFVWWLDNAREASSGFGETCAPSQMWAADGYRGWGQFRIAECTGGDSHFATPGARRLFVIATRQPIAN